MAATTRTTTGAATCNWSTASLLLPNAKFEMSDFSSSGGSFNNDLLAYDLSLYYRLFNNDLFQIDLGLTGRRYDGDFNTQHYSYDKDVLMAYTGVKYASRGPALPPSVMPACRMPTTTTTVWAAPTSSLPCRSRSAPAGVRPRWTSIASIRPSTAGSSVVNSPSDLPEEHMGHIIVTGAGSGLGRALTIGLVERGHQVSMMGRRYQKLQEREELLGKAVIGIAADLAHHEEVDVAFAAAVEWGGLPDMVIHCAGVGEFGPVGVYTAEQIRRVVESNLISTILVAQQTVRLIGDKGGVLANVLSSAAQTGKANESLYCASKWGMRGFLESLRAELKSAPLRLVNLYPSGIRSEFWENSDPWIRVVS